MRRREFIEKNRFNYWQHAWFAPFLQIESYSDGLTAPRLTRSAQNPTHPEVHPHQKSKNLLLSARIDDLLHLHLHSSPTSLRRPEAMAAPRRPRLLPLPLLLLALSLSLSLAAASAFQSDELLLHDDDEFEGAGARPTPGPPTPAAAAVSSADGPGTAARRRRRSPAPCSSRSSTTSAPGSSPRGPSPPASSPPRTAPRSAPTPPPLLRSRAVCPSWSALLGLWPLDPWSSDTFRLITSICCWSGSWLRLD